MTPRSRCVLAVVTAPLAIVLASCASGSLSPAASAGAGSSAAPAASQSPASPAGPANSITPGGPRATSSGAPTTRAAECTSAQLTVAYTSNAQIRNGALDGMSHADSVITFTNRSSRPCWTRGYPGVAALDAAGHQLKQAVRGQAANGQTPLITLAPGQVASAEVTGNTASCSSLTRIAAFLVTAPDQRTSVRLSGSHLMCLNSLGVDPLQRGNAGGLPL
jgi:Protein of unknown function (DUF4232)